jgi:hypothetical protein
MGLSSNKILFLSDDVLRMFLWCSEVLNRTLHPIALAAGLHRVDQVVVGRFWLEVIKTYSENRRWMIRTHPDRRFCGLDQAIWIGAIVHNSKMHRGSAGIIRCPADNRQILFGQLDLGSLDDSHLWNFWSVRTYLSAEAATQNRDRQYGERSSHAHLTYTDDLALCISALQRSATE